MIRSELIKLLADENFYLELHDVEAIVDTFFKTIAERLVADGRVELRGFGAFSTRARNARIGRNPRTGGSEGSGQTETLFKPGKKMRALLKGRQFAPNSNLALTGQEREHYRRRRGGRPDSAA